MSVIFIATICFILLLYISHSCQQQLKKNHQRQNISFDMNQQDLQTVTDVLQYGNVDKYSRLYSYGHINKDFIMYMQYITSNFIFHFYSDTKHILHHRLNRFFAKLYDQIQQIDQNVSKSRIDKCQHYWKSIIAQGDDETAQNNIKPKATIREQDYMPIVDLDEQHMILALIQGLDDKFKSDSQNVHQKAVVQSAKIILDSISPVKSTEHIDLTHVTRFIQQIPVNNVKKEQAIASAKHIFNNGIKIDVYDKTEQQILIQTVQQLENNKNTDHNVYFVEQLAECVSVCPMGRVVRLIDVIGFTGDQKIIPDHVIKEQILTKMSQLYAQIDDLQTVKSQLTDYIQQNFQSKGLITQSKAQEFVEMVDFV